MAWWKVAYLERYRKQKVDAPSVALLYILNCHNLNDAALPFNIDNWQTYSSGRGKTSKRWLRDSYTIGDYIPVRVKIDCVGTIEDSKQIIKVMVNRPDIKMIPSWRKMKKPRGWFTHRARRRGQQKFHAEQNKAKKKKKKNAGGKKDGKRR